MTEKELKIKSIYSEIQNIRVKKAREHNTGIGTIEPIVRINQIMNLEAQEKFLVKLLASELGLFNFSVN